VLFTAVSLIRQPGTAVLDGFCFATDVFFSSRVLRGRSTNHPETLPHDCNLAEFYNPTPKIRRGGGGHSPKKFGGEKHAKFQSILDHFRL